jgi:CheY-like chemotaxis protein
MAEATVSMASASEAMERILARRPEVLVCDIGMPGEDGYSLVRRLRVLEERQESALPAVALSAYVRSQDRTASHPFRFSESSGEARRTGGVVGYCKQRWQVATPSDADYTGQIRVILYAKTTHFADQRQNSGESILTTQPRRGGG